MTYPTIMPAITLDFANSQQLDPRITFSRSSGATYINSAGQVASAADHEARFDHDGNGECLGLLIEESRANLFDESENLAAWSSSFWTKANNQAISPDGTLNAASFVPNVGTTSQSSGRAVTHPQSGEYTCSVFAKPNGITKLKMRFSGSSYQAFFDLTGDGSVIQDQNGTASILKYPNGWYKCIFTINDAVGETAEWQLGHNDTTSVDGTNGFYVWGMQVEEGSFPTSYIPTSGSTVTRADDVCQIEGDNFSRWYSQSYGTIVTGHNTPTQQMENSTAATQMWSFNDGSTSNRIHTTQAVNGQIGYKIAAGGATSARYNDNVWSNLIDVDVKSAMAYATDNVNWAYQGILQTADTSAAMPTGINKVNIGANLLNLHTFTGHISRLSYYNERLTDAELQTLTS